jgi:hypothetical protein
MGTFDSGRSVTIKKLESKELEPGDDDETFRTRQLRQQVQ